MPNNTSLINVDLIHGITYCLKLGFLEANPKIGMQKHVIF